MKRRDFLVGIAGLPFVLPSRAIACSGDGPYAYFYQKDNNVVSIDSMDDFFNDYYGVGKWRYSDEMNTELSIPKIAEDTNQVTMKLKLGKMPPKYDELQSLEFFNEAGTALIPDPHPAIRLRRYGYRIGSYIPSGGVPLDFIFRYKTLGHAYSCPYIAWKVTAAGYPHTLIYRHPLLMKEHSCGGIQFIEDDSSNVIHLLANTVHKPERKDSNTILYRCKPFEKHWEIKMIVKSSNRLKYCKVYPEIKSFGASFVKRIEVRNKYELLAGFDGTQWVASSPYYKFNIPGLPKGTELNVSWVMNTGERHQDKIILEKFVRES